MLNGLFVGPYMFENESPRAVYIYALFFNASHSCLLFVLYLRGYIGTNADTAVTVITALRSCQQNA